MRRRGGIKVSEPLRGVYKSIACVAELVFLVSEVLITVFAIRPNCYTSALLSATCDHFFLLSVRPPQNFEHCMDFQKAVTW